MTICKYICNFTSETKPTLTIIKLRVVKIFKEMNARIIFVCDIKTKETQPCEILGNFTAHGV